MTPRVVADSSALLSAERDEILYLASRGAIQLVLSPFLMSEVVRIRTERAIMFGQDREAYRARINAYVNALTSLSEMVNHTLLEGGNYTSWLRDPDDEPLLATALVGQAEIVVSWNTKDFPPSGSYAHIRFLTPPQLFEEVYQYFPRRIPEEEIQE